jgi:hypothetical protein
MQHPSPQPINDIQVLAFDVFGTVVDWHGSIAREMAANYPHVDGSSAARENAASRPLATMFYFKQFIWRPHIECDAL